MVTSCNVSGLGLSPCKEFVTTEHSGLQGAESTFTIGDHMLSRKLVILRRIAMLKYRSSAGIWKMIYIPVFIISELVITSLYSLWGPSEDYILAIFGSI